MCLLSAALTVSTLPGSQFPFPTHHHIQQRQIPPRPGPLAILQNLFHRTQGFTTTTKRPHVSGIDHYQVLKYQSSQSYNAWNLSYSYLQSICVQPLLAHPHTLPTIAFHCAHSHQHVCFLKILPHPHPHTSPGPQKIECFIWYTCVVSNQSIGCRIWIKHHKTHFNAKYTYILSFFISTTIRTPHTWYFPSRTLTPLSLWSSLPHPLRTLCAHPHTVWVCCAQPHKYSAKNEYNNLLYFSYCVLT